MAITGAETIIVVIGINMRIKEEYVMYRCQDHNARAHATIVTLLKSPLKRLLQETIPWFAQLPFCRVTGKP